MSRYADADYENEKKPITDHNFWEVWDWCVLCFGVLMKAFINHLDLCCFLIKAANPAVLNDKVRRIFG